MKIDFIFGGYEHYLQRRKKKSKSRHLRWLWQTTLPILQLERGEVALFLSAYTEAVTDHVLLIEEGVSVV